MDLFSGLVFQRRADSRAFCIDSFYYHDCAQFRTSKSIYIHLVVLASYVDSLILNFTAAPDGYQLLDLPGTRLAAFQQPCLSQQLRSVLFLAHISILQLLQDSVE